MGIEKDIKDLQRNTGQMSRNEAQVAALSTWLSMSKLVACWDMRSVDSERRIYDHSGQGRSLEMMNGFTSSFDTAPYVSLTAAQWLFRYGDSGLAQTGAITLACWVRPTTALAATNAVIGLWQTVNGCRSYMLGYRNTGFPFATISLAGAGGAGSQEIISTKTVILNTWSFLALKFIPNTELSIFHNMIKDSLLAGVFASMFSSYSKFEINGINWGLNYTTTLDIGLSALYATNLTDGAIYQLFQSSRGWYGA